MDQILDLKNSLLNEEFYSIEDLSQRVNYAFDKIESVEEIRNNLSEYLSELKNKNKKSSEKSRYYRQKGNQYLEHKNLEYALYYYSLAILCAPYSSDSTPEDQNELSYAFTSRSIVQSELKAYDNALFDIDCALKVTGLSMGFHQRVQLMTHKVNCLCHLRQYKTAIAIVSYIIELIPCLPNYNDLVKNYIHFKEQILEALYSESMDEMPIRKSNVQLIEEQLKNASNYLSSDLKLCQSKTKGRHYVAKKDIPSRTIIIVEKAVVVTIFKDYYRSHCHNCLRNLGYKWWPCRHCRNVVFCGEECAQSDEHHKYECGIIDAIQSLGPTHHMALRFMLSIGAQTAVALKRTDSSEKTLNDINEMDFWNITNLVDHRDKYDLNCKVMSICRSIQMAFLLDTFEELRPNYSGLNRMKEIAALLDQYNYKVVVNVFGINESFEELRPFRGEHVGNAIAIRSSFFNHSCSPNAFWVFNGRYITISTKDDVKCGEEITISYGPRSSDSHSLEKRQSLLKERYFFQCQCSDCLKGVAGLSVNE